MEFILDTDASGHGIGAVLSQVQYGTERVIAYFSRVLNKAERNYCVTRRELLAIVDSLKSFHHYLYGQKFIIRTDHQSLKWLLSFKNLEGQLARWIERVQQYDFKIEYRRGKTNGNADGLSRRPCEENLCSYCSRVETREAVYDEKVLGRIIFGESCLVNWRKEQLEDPAISVILFGKERQQRPPWQIVSPKEISTKVYWSYWDQLVLKDGVLCKKWESPSLTTHVIQIIVPRNRIREILEEAHDSPSGGHFGVNKTLDRIRRKFYWATCKRDVENWCKSCKTCVAKKGPVDKGKSPLQIYNVGLPMERLQMDVLGPLPITLSGNRYLLVIVDCFTKWVEAFPVRNIKASTVADVFVKQFISRHGVPLELHTDQGRNFESRLFQEVTRLLGIKKTRTSALHPQSDGQVERQHFTIVNYLSKFISDDQKDWDRWVPMFLLAYRSSKHESTGVSPAELHLGRELRLPLDLLRGVPPSETVVSDDYCRQLQEKLNSVHEIARRNLSQKSLSSKLRYDRHVRKCHFPEGSKVWFYNPRRRVGKAPKLQSHWEGPFEVVKKLSEVVYCIRRSRRHKNKIIHSDRLAPFCERVI